LEPRVWLQIKPARRGGSALALSDGVAVKKTVALAREGWDGWPVAGAGPQGLSPRWFWVVAGELLTAFLLFASGNVPPVVVRSLQLFLRF
jgi:hypothetical protein